MSAISTIQFSIGTASLSQIERHLKLCSADFIPPLADRVQLDSYSKKLFSKSTTFEAWRDKRLVGLLAAYMNENGRSAFISSVSVLPSFRSQGIANRLLDQCHLEAKCRGLQTIALEVSKTNTPAILLYKKHGYALVAKDPSTHMGQLRLGTDT